ncbi:MAG: TatD family hydrolase [Calditrichia bacterium]
MLNLTDTHTHLHFGQFEKDLPAVLQRARDAGVNRILTLGTELESSRKSLQIAEENPSVYAAVGLHPTDIRQNPDRGSGQFAAMIKESEKVAAIGEIGLDLYWKEVPLQEQLPVFKNMLELAAELELPVVIHNREAQAEMQQFFRENNIHRLHGVMHSFAGTPADVQFYLEKGLHISFTGVVTFKNFRQWDTVRQVPLERLLLETDSPFLTPEPYRGRGNEPSFVRFTAEKLAEFYEMDFADLCRITSENAAALFAW